MVKTQTFSGEVSACCHRVGFYWNIDEQKIDDELEACLTEEAENRAKEMIVQGYLSGELCAVIVEHEFYGWWTIEQ